MSSGRGDLGVAGEFGLVGDLAGAEEFVAVDRQGHEAADAGDFALRGLEAGPIAWDQPRTMLKHSRKAFFPPVPSAGTEGR